MRKQRFLFLIALSAAVMLPAGFAMAAPPVPQAVLLKPGTVVNLSQVPQTPTPRGKMAVPVPYHYANPAMVGRLKAALAAGENPHRNNGGSNNGHGGGPSGGGGGTPPPPPTSNFSSGVIAKSFQGLGMSDYFYYGFDVPYAPPDTILTAGVNGTSGATDILEAVNLEGEVFNADTQASVWSFDLAAFTPVYGDSVSDPRVMYDAATQRWFIALITYSPMSDAGWDLAVSAGNDPSDPATNAWVLFYLPTGTIQNPDGSTGNFPDFPKMGLNGDKLVLTGDAYSAKGHGPKANYTYQGTEFVVINKSELLTAVDDAWAHRNDTGYTPPGVCTTFFPPDEGATAIEPAENLEPPTSTINGTTDTLYMAAVDSSVASTNTLHIWTVTGNARLDPSDLTNQTCLNTETALATPTSITLPADKTISIPPNAQQEGSSTLIDTNDDNLLDAMFRPSESDSSGSTGTLWVAGNDGCIPSGDSSTRSCARFIEVNIGSGGAMNVAQDFDYGWPGYYFYYPALRTDSAGDLVAVFTGSSSGSFPSVYAGMQLAGTLNELPDIQLIKLGNYQDTLSTPRWGDYSGASTDPSDSTIWIGGEYSTVDPYMGSVWGTWVANIDPSKQ